VAGLIAMLLVVAILAAIFMGGGPNIPEGAALIVNPAGSLVEQKTVYSAAEALQSNDLPQQTLVKEVVDAITLAKDDKSIKLIVLDLNALQGGLIPKLETVATAVEDFRTSGKKVIAVANIYSQSAIYLAAHADEVLLNPEGFAIPQGFAMYRAYFKDFLDKHDVTVNLFKVGKYKSAVDPFFRNDMSEEDRQARMDILDAWWQAYTKDIEAARNMTNGSIDALLHNGPEQLQGAQGNLARLALESGFVDRLVTDAEQRAYLIELVGEDKESRSYRGVDYQAYLRATQKRAKHKASKVAVITAVGAIIDGKAPPGQIGGESLKNLVRKARLDADVKAIVVRIDSGGGSKAASEIIRTELSEAQKSGIPVVASMGSVAASGGYWIAATADEIWASSTTVTGSIGIFGLLPSFEKTLARYGIYSDGISTTPIAGGASVMRGVSPSVQKVLQTIIDAGYQQFLTTVANGRGMSEEAVHEIAQGRIWTGKKALELGLVDKLGDLNQSINAAARLADVEDYSVWYVEPDLSLEEQILKKLSENTKYSLDQARKNPLSLIRKTIEAEFPFLENLNDPQNAYAICIDCPMSLETF